MQKLGIRALAGSSTPIKPPVGGNAPCRDLDSASQASEPVLKLNSLNSLLKQGWKVQQVDYTNRGDPAVPGEAQA